MQEAAKIAPVRSPFENTGEIQQTPELRANEGISGTVSTLAGFNKNVKFMSKFAVLRSGKSNLTQMSKFQKHCKQVSESSFNEGGSHIREESRINITHLDSNPLPNKLTD